MQHFFLVFLLGLILSGSTSFAASSRSFQEGMGKCSIELIHGIRDVTQRFPDFEQQYVMTFRVLADGSPVANGLVLIRDIIKDELLIKFYNHLLCVKDLQELHVLNKKRKALVKSFQKMAEQFVVLDQKCSEEMNRLTREKFTNKAVFDAIYAKSNCFMTYFNVTVPKILRKT